jgi:hypothetical protein
MTLKLWQNKCVVKMGCLSAMWLSKSSVSFGGHIDVFSTESTNQMQQI